MFQRKPIGELAKPTTTYLTLSVRRCLQEQAKELGISFHALCQRKLGEGCDKQAGQSG